MFASIVPTQTHGHPQSRKPVARMQGSFLSDMMPPADQDSDSKESFIYHTAGIAGMGGSSYIDSVILRDRDANTAWTAASDATLEERRYLLQNWRADVTTMVNTSGEPIEWYRYTAYGQPTSHPIADVNGDGSVTSADTAAWLDLQSGDSSGSVWLTDDLNRDDVFPGDTADDTFFYAQQTAASGLSSGYDRQSAYGLRKGYAWYEWDDTLAMWHVRHRVLDSTSGKWTKRDPLEYVDGMNDVAYISARPIALVDPLGLTAWSNIDFVWHYITGGGQPVDLADVGLYWSYWLHPAVKSTVNANRNSLLTRAEITAKTLALTLDCRCETSTCDDAFYWTKNGRLSVSRAAFVQNSDFMSTAFWFADWTFSIGGHFINYNSVCWISASCCSDEPLYASWSYKCSILWQLDDTFRDVSGLVDKLARYLASRSGIDIREWRSRLVRAVPLAEPGTPFNITSSFSTTHIKTGKVSRLNQGNCCPCPW